MIASGLSLVIAGMSLASSTATIATSAQAPVVKDRVQLFGTLRLRSESWGWFNPVGGGYDNNYTFSHNQLRFGAKLPVAHRISGLRPFETVAEAASPLLLGLPHNASGPAPIGSLGMGGQYRLLNGSQQGSLYIKQAYFRMPQANDKPEILAGRFEFTDGTEALPGDADLAYIQSQRVAARVISPDPFTVVGRSMDGVKVSRTVGNHVQTFTAFYPTTGAFNLDGGDSISKVRQIYASDSRMSKTSSSRLFVENHVDARGLKVVDNSAVPTTTATKITTLGGSAITSRQVGNVRTDVLAWGGVQVGQWGAAVQQAYAAVLEAGVKPANLGGWWLRGGAGYFSGDSNPNDNKHQSWAVQTIPPRLLFRTPVVTESNLNDIYAMAIKRNKRETIRLEAHTYRLDKLADRWYTGGPVSQSTGIFGLTGKPNGGARDIGTAVDLSYDVNLNARDVLSIYTGYVHGGNVVSSSYAGRSAFLGFVQVVRKF